MSNIWAPRFPNRDWPLDTIVVDLHLDDLEFYESTAHYRNAKVWYNGRELTVYSNHGSTLAAEELLNIREGHDTQEENQHFAVLFFGKLLLLDLWINSNDVITTVALSEVQRDGTWEQVSLLNSHLAGKRIAGMRICMFDTPDCSTDEREPELTILRPGRPLGTYDCVGDCWWDGPDTEPTG